MPGGVAFQRASIFLVQLLFFFRSSDQHISYLSSKRRSSTFLAGFLLSFRRDSKCLMLFCQMLVRKN